jgi:tetratricopeptide (TPR) repeat protein
MNESEAGIAFRLLGTPRFSVGGRAWVEFANDGAALLLAYVGRHGTTPRATLAELFWRGDTGRQNLRQSLYTLNDLVRRHGWRQRVLVGRDSLDLQAGVAVDTAGDFHDAMARGEDGALLPGLGIRALPGDGREWLETLRARWLRLRAERCERAAADLRRRGRTAEAITLLEHALAADPAQTRLVVLLAELHLLRGEPEAGLGAIGRHGHADDAAIAALRVRLQQQRAAPRAPGVMPQALRADTLFESRRAVLSQMRRAWDDGRAFGLEGESGSGKTHLLTRLADERSGVVLVNAVEGDHTIAYGTARRWLEACRRRWPLIVDERHRAELCRLLPSLGTPPAGAGTEGALHAAHRAAMESARAGGMRSLLVDDLHWADEASLALLARCAAAVPGLRLGFALRRDAGAAAAELIGRLAAAGDGAPPIPLQALSVHDVGAIVDADPSLAPLLAGRAEEILHASGGSPWHVIDLLRRCVERSEADAAIELHSAQTTRIDALLPRLSAASQSVLWLAAVAGGDFSLGLAASLLGADESTIDGVKAELTGAALLEAHGGVHDIVRAQLRARLDEPAACELHARIATALARNGGAPERIAHHLAAAGKLLDAARQGERAASNSELAGKRGGQSSWLAQAARWYREAGDAGAALRVEIEALEPCLHSQGSDATLARAAALAPAASAEQAAWIEVTCARAFLLKQQTEPALRHALAARRAPAASADTVALADAVATIVRAWQGRTEEALRVIEPAMARIGDHADSVVRQELWSAYGIALAHAERWRSVTSAWPAMLQDAKRIGDLAYELDALHSLASAYGALGQVELALDMQRREIQLRGEIDDNPHSGRVAHMNLAVNLIATGQYREAVDRLQAVLAAAQADGDDANTYRNAAEDLLAEAWLALGRPDRAALQVAAEPLADNAARRLSRALLRARAAAQAGERDAASRWQAALQLAEAPDTPDARRTRALLQASDALDPRAAEAVCDGAVALACRADNPVLELLARLHRARLQRRRGAVAGALADVDRMLDLARDTQSIYVHRPELWAVAVDVLLDAGQTARARACLLDARDWLLRVAEQQVPAGLRDGFLDHPVHRGLLERAAAEAP